MCLQSSLAVLLQIENQKQDLMCRKNLLYWCLPVLVSWLGGCTGGDVQPDIQTFEAFYEEFHKDSTYQMLHITFPLEGLPSDADAETIAAGDFRWDAENWELHRPFNFATNDFERDLVAFGNDIVIEKIIHRSGQFGTIRRFAKMGDEWYLIYYAGMNRIAQ